MKEAHRTKHLAASYLAITTANVLPRYPWRLIILVLAIVTFPAEQRPSTSLPGPFP